MYQQKRETMIIDCGSGMCRAGLSNYQAPISFPSVAGKPKYVFALNGQRDHSTIIGEQAMQMKGALSLKYPIKNGIVNDWDNIQKIWNHCYHWFETTPDNHVTLLTEALNNPKQNRQKTCQIFFEEMNVPGLCLFPRAVLSLVGCGRTTGLVLDPGDGVTQAVPISDGLILSHAIGSIELGGKDITEYLARLLQENGFRFQSPEEVRKIKQKVCRVSQNLQEELKCYQKSFDQSYELPDGQVINMSNQRILAPEVLFQPGLVGKAYPGLHELCHQTIQKCDFGLRQNLYRNIVLCGGTALIPGFADRLNKQMKKLAQRLIVIGSSLHHYHKVKVLLGWEVSFCLTFPHLTAW